jgi:hypothetical protein
MSFASKLEVLVVNEVRTGSKDGRQWSMQDAECVLLNDDGSPSQVGVLMIPKDLQGKVTRGAYTATFALRPNMASRRIEAVLTGLTPIPRASASPKAS